MRYYHRKKRKKKKLLILLFVFLIILLFFNTSIRFSFHISKSKKYILKNNFPKAMAELKYAAKIKPNNPQIYEIWGFLYTQKGELEKANNYYNNAISLGIKKHYTLNHRKIGENFISNGKYEKALVELSLCSFLDTHSSETWFNLGLAYHGIGNIKEAKRAYKKALLKSPNTKIYETMFEKLLHDERRRKITYIVDTKNYPLARFMLNTNSRVHIYGFSTAHILGYNSVKHGCGGLEEKFKEILPGSLIKTTVDIDLQRIAEKSLSFYKGSVVIINPKTGEILALVSHPTFNPNRIDIDWKKITSNKNMPLLNRAFEKLYEPGSICKIVTLAAFLEDKDKDQIFPVICPGHILIDGRLFYDWKKHLKIKNEEEAFINSCNIAFSEIGFSIGINKIIEYANKFGFNEKLDMELPTSKSTFPTNNLTRLDTAQLSSGLGKDYRITPIQSALIGCAIANKGVIMKPFLIKEIKNIRGDIIYKSKPIVWKRPITGKTAKIIKNIMIRTVQKGTGKKARLKHITIAGKTGTSGSSKNHILNAWFLAIAPADNPKLVVCVVAEGAGQGMHIAAPIAKKIIRKALAK